MRFYVSAHNKEVYSFIANAYLLFTTLNSMDSTLQGDITFSLFR
jgi:hypothetical protein